MFRGRCGYIHVWMCPAAGMVHCKWPPKAVMDDSLKYFTMSSDSWGLSNNKLESCKGVFTRTYRGCDALIFRPWAEGGFQGPILRFQLLQRQVNTVAFGDNYCIAITVHTTAQ